MRPYYENKPNLIFTSHKKGSYDFPSHFHSNIEIAYCFSGIQHVKIGEELYILKKGDAVVIFPNKVHEYLKATASREPTESISLICETGFLADNIPDIVTKYPENPFIAASLISENTALAFEKIRETQNHLALIGWAYIVLSDLIKCLDLAPLDGDLQLPSRITSYIDANFKEPLTIPHIAKIFGYHPSYIAHLFCDQLKIPFRTYLGTVRTEYAAAQIRTTGKSLTEIAYEAGFHSLNTFCRCFKKHFSMTPSQYKKSLHNT